MNVFFDVDYTILSIDGHLRPGTVALFRRLRSEGHAVYIWSGRGARWDVVAHHGLADHVDGVYEKPIYEHRERLGELGIDVEPDFVVDDHEDVVYAFGGYIISRYYYGQRDYADPHAGDELHRVYDAILAADSARAG